MEICTRHLQDDVDKLVRDWFAGLITNVKLNGERSIEIAVPDDEHRIIKIKGAGSNGKEIQFGNYLDRGPVAPLFDYDGRRMVDVSFGHDGAFVGGCSMQQAINEWRVTSLVQELGYRAVPCLGYGSVLNGSDRSWFSVFELDNRWTVSVKPPHGVQADYEKLAVEMGKITMDLAINHRLIGFAWLVRDLDGTGLLKDLHPYRKADPVNMSQLSWVMQVIYALQINAISSRFLCDAWYKDDSNKEAPLWQYRAAYSEATLADWDHLRFSVIAPYMINEPTDFSSERLADLLESNPISAKLMQICPPEFAPLR